MDTKDILDIKIINDIIIRPLNNNNNNKNKTHKYKELFNSAYFLLYILAHVGSGKTTTIYRILQHVINVKYTKIYIFSSTNRSDKTFEIIKQKLEKHNINVNIYDDLEQLEDIYNASYEYIETNKEKIDKRKYTYPEFIFIFDDISHEIKRSAAFEKLIKNRRHIRAAIIISSQYLHDVSPAVRLNTNYLFVFQGQPEAKLKIINEEFMGSLSYDIFQLIYNYATQEKYNFLFLENNNIENIRHNLNEKMTIRRTIK